MDARDVEVWGASLPGASLPGAGPLCASPSVATAPDTDAPAAAPALVLAHRHGVTQARGPTHHRAGYRDGGDVGGPGPGIFFEWAWDGRQLDAVTDRYGFHPAFVFHAPERMGISPSVTALLEAGAPRELDDAALAVFLRLGFFIGEDTPFRAIRALPPAAQLRWRDGRCVSHSWRRGGPPAPFTGSRDAALDAMGELVQSAVERLRPAPGERALLPLSGGRDSRHLLLALCRAGTPPAACITLHRYPPASDDDVPVAAEVARALGIPHHLLPLARDRLGAEMRKNAATGYCADEHDWFLPLAEHVRRGNYDVVYDGIAGDVLSAGLFLTPERHRLFAEGAFGALAEHLLGGEGYLPGLLPPPLYRRWSRALAVEHLARELARHAMAPNPTGQFFFWNRTRREIALAPWALLAGPARVVAPFLNDAVYDFLATLPASLLFDHTFHDEAIRRYYPEHAALRYASGSARPSTDRAPARQFARALLALLARPGARPPLVRRRYVAPRLLRALAHPGYANDTQSLVTLALYLMQVGTVSAGAAAT